MGRVAQAVFALPDDLRLDESVRQAATSIAQEHMVRARALWRE
jgi:hypothetical protein